MIVNRLKGKSVEAVILNVGQMAAGKSDIIAYGNWLAVRRSQRVMGKVKSKFFSVNADVKFKKYGLSSRNVQINYRLECN